jgi:hypothetical protein
MPPLFALETGVIRRWNDSLHQTPDFSAGRSLFAFKAVVPFVFYSKLISVSKRCQFFTGFGKKDENLTS